MELRRFYFHLLSILLIYRIYGFSFSGRVLMPCAHSQDSYVKMLRNETFDDTIKDGKWVVVFQNVALDFVTRDE